MLFVPLCAWALTQLRHTGVLSRGGLVAVLACGLGAHAVLVTSLLAHARGLISESLLLVTNVLNGLLPLGLGSFVRLGRERRPNPE